MSITRRQFLGSTVGATILAGLPMAVPAVLWGAPRRFRAAIIGHTGQGNYGHNHDVIFRGRENIEVAAVADPDAAGRARAIERSGAQRGYSDYREMIEKEKPELVCIAPRWTGEHHAMAMTALRAGAHLYVEKPITQTLAEADELLALAAKSRRKIVVAHQMRLAPNTLLLGRHLKRGLVGDLVEMRACGKQDRRAGGEDLVVLGVHLFDLMRFFAGDALWCAARVRQEGRVITRQDARAATEDIGPVTGDDIMAGFSFRRGVYGSFVSRSKNREAADSWVMDLAGSRGSVRILLEMVPRIFVSESKQWTERGAPLEWRPWREDPTLTWAGSERSMSRANERVVDDWLEAIRKDREPTCSGRAGMKALEMAMAVFAAGLKGARVELPLKQREHPLKA